MKISAIALVAAVLGFLGSSTAEASTIVGDTVLFQGCALVPLFPTDCTGAPSFATQTTVVTADATDSFAYGVMSTNVQSNFILMTLGPGAGVGAFFNGTLVRGIDWVGSPSEVITGFTLTNNTIGLPAADVKIFEGGRSVAINVGDPILTPGSVTINLTTSAIPEPSSLLLLGSGLALGGVRRYRRKK